MNDRLKAVLRVFEVAHLAAWLVTLLRELAAWIVRTIV